MTGPDYQTLIDSETWAFIKATEACYPADTATQDIASQRRIYDAMCAVFRRPYPAGVTATDLLIAGVPCRRYAGGTPSVIYFHGGSFLVGGLHSHDDVCAEICAATGLAVIAVEYRLSPEHGHPAAFDDACAVVRAIAATGPVVLVGDSAGGNLAAAASGALRGDVAPLGQVLIYPGLGGNLDQGSYITHAEAPMLTRADVVHFVNSRGQNGKFARDATSAPLTDTDFSGLPPTFAVAAECDPLADDAEAYAQAIRAAGGRAEAIIAKGMVHGALRARHMSHRAATMFSQICVAITALAQGDWPYGEQR